MTKTPDEQIIEQLTATLQSPGTDAVPAADSLAGSITQLLPRIRQGDIQAEHELYLLTCQELAKRAEQILRQFPRLQLEPDEIISDQYERLSKILASVDISNRGHFFGIACRRFRWHLQTLVRSRRVTDPMVNLSTFSGLSVSASQPLDKLDRLEQLDRLLDAIGQLDEKHQQIIDLKFNLGMTFEQIGKQLNCATSTAKERFDRAMAALRRQVDPDGTP